jgi:galactokinase
MTSELDRVEEAYIRRYGERPLAIARAPGRVNLIGEHIDYNDGWVLPAAIERSVYLAFGPLSDSRLEIVSLDLDRHEEAAIPDPAVAAEKQTSSYPDWLRYGAGVSWVLQRSGFKTPGLRGVLCSSVPIGSGLSSSAALESSFAVAWQKLGGWQMERMDLAKACQQAEHAFAGVRCGLMDQFASLHGKRGSALLLDCRSLEWREVPLPSSVAMVIANTRSPHKLESSAYNERRGQCEEAVRILAELHPGLRSLRDVTPQMLADAGNRLPAIVRQRAEHVVGECARTIQAVESLEAGDLKKTGALMNASHDSLRDLYAVSGPELDAMVAAARTLPGCYGARLTGGGFGGCTVQLVERDRADAFVAELTKKYKAATGIDPEILISQPSAGAEILNTNHRS